ncbi:MAG: ChaN family lipoprotein [Candidatus Latescibacteria bacterium]|nr:ChaN family lipoprotein [Candidatus Latescibacterota bacterium]
MAITLHYTGGTPLADEGGPSWATLNGREKTMGAILRKITKLILKVVGGLAGVIVFLLVIYAIFNTPFAAKYKKPSDVEMHGYLDYLDTHVSDPLQFVGEKFDRYDVVLVGEMHRRKQDVEFVKTLIPYLYSQKGVTVIGWEFGASDFQSEVDSLVNAPEFDEKKAIELMRRSFWEWDFQQYLDIYRIVWELNKTIPPQKEKIRFLQLGSDFNERKLRSPDPAVSREEAQRYFYDRKMADIIEREVLLKGKKALWYSGLHHALTRYRQPGVFFKHADLRGGNVLYDKYPSRVCLVTLHQPVLGRLALWGELFPLLRPFCWKLNYPWGGVIDKVYERRRHPFAFDTLDSPFGELEDNYSYYSLDRWGALKLKDFCDGYVVLCSFEEAEPVNPIRDWVTSPAELEEVKDRMSPEHAAEFHDIPVFLDSLERDIPQTIRWAHDVDKAGY